MALFIILNWFLSKDQASMDQVAEEAEIMDAMGVAGDPAPTTSLFDFELLKDLKPKILTREVEVTKSTRLQVLKIVGPWCKTNRPANQHMTTFVQDVTLEITRKMKGLEDWVDGQREGLGNKRLRDQVYHWLENHTRDDRDEPSKKRCKSVVGQPTLKNSAAPVEHMLACQNARQVLQEIYNSSPDTWDLALIRKLLQDSYALQRSQINSEENSVARLIFTEWPFLFHPVGAIVHFAAGCEFNPRDSLDAFITTEYQYLRYYCLSKGGLDAAKKDLDAQRKKLVMRGQDTRSLTLVSSIDLITTLFKQNKNTQENISKLFVMLKEDQFNRLPLPGCLAPADLKLPNTPCFVGQGNSALLCTAFYVFVDTIRVGGPHSALQGMKVVFASQFMLQCSYNESVRKSMQFYERVVVKYRSGERAHSDVTNTLCAYDSFKTKLKEV